MDGRTVRSAVASAAFALGAAFGSTALADSPSVFYVAPDGTGGGTSWEDATDLAMAFTKAAEAGGGEIWLKEGWYGVTAVYAPCSDLTVRGGFAGNETSADAADPKAHPTVLSGDNKQSVYGWTVNGTMPKKGDENYAPIWTDDGEFNVARADDVVAKYRLPCLSTAVGLTQVIKSSTVFPDGTLKEFPLMTKRMVAKRILEEIENEE